MGKKSAKKVVEVDAEEEEEKEDVLDDGSEEIIDRKGKRPQGKPAKKGYNFSAIIILMMFVIPSVAAIVIQVMDFMYPEAKTERIVRDRVISCYEAANPTKLSEVDRFVKRYKGKEHVLFAQLKAKYPKVPECQY